MPSDAAILERVLGSLRQVRLEAVLVGNAAAVLHGAPVLTEDLDFVVRDTRRNREKIRELTPVEEPRAAGDEG